MSDRWGLRNHSIFIVQRSGLGAHGRGAEARRNVGNGAGLRLARHQQLCGRGCLTLQNCQLRLQGDVRWPGVGCVGQGHDGPAASILLTRNEVGLHLKAYPLNALIVVHVISLSANRRAASGGELIVLSPWRLDPDRLTGITYQYRLGDPYDRRALGHLFGRDDWYVERKRGSHS